jgi:NADH/F420H2 dehydrogenase subunit C
MSTVVEPSVLSAPSEKIRERLSGSPLAGRVEVRDLDLPTLEVGPESWLDLAQFLRDDPESRYDLFLDIAGVDNLRRPGRPTRFESVAHLYSVTKNEHLRVKVLLPDSESPTLPSAIDVWPAANWFEREAFDLYGFQFTGHPNLRRILCHDAFVGNPLRKDYPPGQRWYFGEGRTGRRRRTCARGTSKRRPSRSDRPIRRRTASCT